MFNKNLKKMKKVLLTLALAAFAFTANAQFVIGGNISAYHNGAHDDNYTAAYPSNASTNLSIMPKIGYQLNEDMQIGAQLGWSYRYTRNYAGADNTYMSNSPRSAFSIAPYFRYNFATWKKFTIFCEATLNFTLGFETETHTIVNGSEAAGSPVKNGNNYTSFGISVVPGMNYSFSDKFSMDLYVNIARLYWNMTSYDGASEHSWGIDADMNKQSINNHLNTFGIGFNYHF